MTARRQWLAFLLLACLTGSGAVRAAEPAALLQFKQIIDGTGEVLDATQVVVAGSRIAAVGNDLQQEYPHARVVDLSALTALPGLIDVHVHLTYGLPGPSHGDAWAELLATSPSERLVAGVRNAAATLATGVTSVRDLFAFDGVEQYLAALLDSGAVPGPRLFNAGLALHPMTVPSHLQGAALAEFFVTHVEQQAAQGSTWVKIFASSGSADDLSDRQHYFYPELKAATERAHALGMKVAVHSYGPSAVADALDAGVDSIEHPVGLNASLWQRWAATDTYYVPTIDHNRYYAEHRGEYGYDAPTARQLGEFVERNVAALRMAHAAGVRIAMGSDAVMSMFGQNTRELGWFAGAGIPVADIIRMATLNGAELLGVADRIGRIQAGFAADIIAVQADPLTDVAAIVDGPLWVMANGRISGG